MQDIRTEGRPHARLKGKTHINDLYQQSIRRFAVLHKVRSLSWLDECWSCRG